jgi:hypothetical protein
VFVWRCDVAENKSCDIDSDGDDDDDDNGSSLSSSSSWVEGPSTVARGIHSIKET